MMTQAAALHRFVRSRRSVRSFLPDAVHRDVLERVLETATWAPSAHNSQPWRFFILVDDQKKLRLADRMGTNFRCDLQADGLDPHEIDQLVSRSRSRILNAPVVIILALDTSFGRKYPDKKRQQAEYLMDVQSLALAGGNLLLAAHAEGLGAVWICAPLFAQEAVCQVLGISDKFEPQGMLLLGWPANTPKPRQRLPLQEVAWFL